MEKATTKKDNIKANDLAKLQQLALAYKEANNEIDYDFDVCLGDGL